MYNLFTENLHLSLALFVQIFGILCAFSSFWWIGNGNGNEMNTQYMYWMRIKEEMCECVHVRLSFSLCVCAFYYIKVEIVITQYWSKQSVYGKLLQLQYVLFHLYLFEANNKKQNKTLTHTQIQLTTICV